LYLAYEVTDSHLVALSTDPETPPSNTTAIKRIRDFITGRIPVPWRASMELLRQEGR
jgi:hypothetical protein